MIKRMVVCALFIDLLLGGCAQNWHDFTGNNRDIAQLRMDTASCQRDSQNAPQTDSSSCTTKGCAATVAVANVLATANAFNTCMEAQGWERAATTTTVAIPPPATPTVNENDPAVLIAVGQADFEAKDYEGTMRNWRKAADQGNANAQTRVGYLYGNGLGVKKSYTTAMEWYRKAADQGFDVAENNIGWLHMKGLGVKKDLPKARYWFKLAAKHGNKEAPTHLADLDIKE